MIEEDAKSEDDLEKFLLSDKFDFEESMEEAKGKDETGFDDEHALPDLPEDLRAIINVDDLQKVINMELEEPELDYEPKPMGDTTKEDYKIDNYDQPGRIELKYCQSDSFFNLAYTPLMIIIRDGKGMIIASPGRKTF